MLPESGLLLRQSEFKLLLDCCPSSKYDWKSVAYKQFEKVLDDKSFPCLFGRRANKSNSCFLLFVSDVNEGGDFLRGMQEYVRMVNATPLQERLFSPLIAFFQKNDFSNLAAEQEFAWGKLQQLHDDDHISWPDAANDDSESSEWTYHFAGLPIFVNMSFPKHKAMRSRSLGEYIVFVINPRENFDEVASSSDESGRKIRQKIRQRIAEYNDGVVPETLGFFGDRASLEWKQYQLQEEGGLSLKRCPLHISADKTKFSNVS